MPNLQPHPKGLAGWLADLDARIAADDAVIARDSALLADRLRRQGREAVAKFLADAARTKELTSADREALAKFIVEYGVTDNLRDAGVRWLREIIIRVEAIAELLPVPASTWRHRICALAPWAIVGGAVLFGFYEPLRDASIVFCRFPARDSLGVLSEYEFRKLLTKPALPPTALIAIAIIVCILAGWRTFAMNAVIAATFICGVDFYSVFANAREWDVPAFCSTIDVKTNAQIMPTRQQSLRIHPTSSR